MSARANGAIFTLSLGHRPRTSQIQKSRGAESAIHLLLAFLGKPSCIYVRASLLSIVTDKKCFRIFATSRIGDAAENYLRGARL
jgi:hypothetical protein